MLKFDQPAEEYSPLERVSSCDPTEKPGVQLFRGYVLSRFGGTDVGIVRACSVLNSEHEEGRAWDWGIVDALETPLADVEGFLGWLFCPQTGDEIVRRAGVMYLIYNRRIWRSYSRNGRPPASWAPYGGSDPHDTHIHLSFNHAAARAELSLYRALGALGPQGVIV